MEVMQKTDYISFTNYVKGSESKTAKSESNDCVVKALAAAFDEEYEVVHKFVAKECNRESRKGVRSLNLLKVFREYEKDGLYLFGKGFRMLEKKEIKNYYGKVKSGEEVWRKMTVGSFLQKYPTGKYVILIKHHAFAIDSSTVIGNREDAEQLRCRVLYAVKVLD